MSEIESIEADKNILGYSINVYRTLKTRQYDGKFGNPKQLFEKVRGRYTGWNFVGKRKTEDSLHALLYLNGELGYFAAVSKKDFMEGVPIYGFQDCLNYEKIDVETHSIKGVETELVSLSEKVLERLVEIKPR